MTDFQLLASFKESSKKALDIEPITEQSIKTFSKLLC